MKVLVLTSTFPRWKDDTEPKFVENLCRCLASENDIDIIAPHCAGAAKEEIVSATMKVFRFRYAPDKWESLAYEGGILPNLKTNPIRLLLVPLFLLGQMWLCTKLLRKQSYDVIHAHWIVPQGLIAILARRLSASDAMVVVTSHGGDLYALKGRVLSAIKSWILRKSDALTVVSKAMHSKAIELGANPEHLSVIPMGVDSYQTFYPLDAHSARANLIFVGRLVDKKGIEYLLGAMPQIIAKHPDTFLHIVGDGPLMPELKLRSIALGIESAVVFEGGIVNTEIPNLLRKALIAVAPSIVTDSGDQEGTPVSIMETMACGCATIVADYPGASDIIDNGSNGFLVPQKDSEAIAEKVCHLLSNIELCESLCKAAQKTVRNRYDWRVVSDAFQNVYEHSSAQ